MSDHPTLPARAPVEHADVANGILAELVELVRELRNYITKPGEWGAIDGVFRLSWGHGAAAGEGPYADFNERGSFRGVMVINETTGDLVVGFAPGAAAKGEGGSETITLKANAWMTLPLRTTTLSLGPGTGAPAQGTATVIAFAVPVPPAMGPGV